MRITFRKQPRYSGMMRLPETLAVSVDGEKVATIQRHNDGNWFWYGLGHNSLWDSPTMSLIECKDAVKLVILGVHQ